MSRQVSDSVALTPATLRPASRGQEAVVTAGPNGAVTLAVDLGGAQFDSSIKYEFATADGKRIASGEAPVPVAGAPLLLVFVHPTIGGREQLVVGMAILGTDCHAHADGRPEAHAGTRFRFQRVKCPLDVQRAAIRLGALASR